MSFDNYSYIVNEKAIMDPEKYINPECMLACQELWSKNIEIFMISNNINNGLCILLLDLSEENEKIINELIKIDSRYFKNPYNGAYGIRVDSGLNASKELLSLTYNFEVQDTKRFQDTKEFLEDYKREGGSLVITDDGQVVMLENPERENATLEEALMVTGKQDLYVPEEGKIYDNKIYLEWHKRYEEQIQLSIEETISFITDEEDNISSEAENLRESFLSSEKEYVLELLKDERIRSLISEYNAISSDYLFLEAKKIVDDVEYGLVPEKDMEFIEKKLIVLLAAIRDKFLLKKLVLFPDYEEELGGRHK